MNAPAKILVVDDEELIRINLRALLEDLGYQVVEASNGREGLKVFQKELPDLVLADLRMPVMDGRTMIGRIHDENPEIPVVVVSVIGTVRDAMELLHLGAWDYVVKPVEDEQGLDILIRRALEKARLLQENRRYRDHLEELVRERTEEIERIGNRNRLIFESVGDGIFGLDLDGKVLFINRSAADFLGFKKDELIGKDLHGLIHMQKENGATYDKEECPVCRTYKDGTCRSTTDEVFWRKNGTSFPVEYISTPIIENGNPIGAVVTFKDIAERQKVERQLQQAEKMEAIGTLAGGIAHDFNNILSSMFGFTEIAKSKLGTGEDINHYLDEVLHAGLRARDLVKHILMFSRQVDIKRAPVLITPLVKECLKFLRASVPSTIEIQRDIVASNATVVADPTEIHQLLMNLCTNAAHAMVQKGGILTVRLAEITIKDEKAPPNHQLKPGRYFKLTIADTGHGIPQELAGRIFEPFFTTKERGEGTGLGLSIVHGIVTKLNGAVSVESEPGKGTAFDVWLPLNEEEAADVRFFDMPSEGGKGNILFVDDENSIVITVKKLLENLGYTVLATTSPRHALEMIKSGKRLFDLVITDLTMPKMTGIELSKQLLSIEPDLPVILCTGFSAAISKDMLKQTGVREIIMKPMIASELAGKISKVFNEDKGEEKRD